MTEYAGTKTHRFITPPGGRRLGFTGQLAPTSGIRFFPKSSSGSKIKLKSGPELERRRKEKKHTHISHEPPGL